MYCWFSRFALTTWLLLTLLIAACTVPVPRNPAEPTAANATKSNTTTAETTTDGGAMATVATRSLRVRKDPDDNSEVVAGIAEGESYKVVGLSADGQWVQLAIEGAVGGAGWVSANFVTVEGDITNINTGQIAANQVPTATASTANDGTPVLIPTPAAGFAVVKTGETRLRVREQPTTDSAIVGYVYNGETYPVLETSADGQWVKIPPSSGDNTDNASGGWVAAEFLLIGQ